MKKIISISSIVPTSTGKLIPNQARTCFTVTGRIEQVQYEDQTLDHTSTEEFGGAKIICKLNAVDAARLEVEATQLSPVPLSIGFKVEALLDLPEYSPEYGYSMTVDAEYVADSIHVGMKPGQLNAIHRNEYSNDAAARSNRQLAVNRQERANQLAQQALETKPTRTKASKR